MTVEQLVMPIPVPGGMIELLPVVTTFARGDGHAQINYATYGDPSDPGGVSRWFQERAGALARVIPPTEEGS